MVILETIAVACSMFSALPMPQIRWNEGNMRYALWAFPLVGGVIGGLCWLWVRLCGLVGVPDLLRGAGLCLLPVLVTGGIHLDGYADTSDALASYGDPARRREILKDPHLGAFAAIRLCGYFAADFALWTCLPAYRGGAVLCIFCLSRTLSGLALTAFPLAEGSGLARSFAEAADRARVRKGLLTLTVLLSVGLVLLGGWTAAAAAGGVFWYYRYRLTPKFEGLSGDLAGWFLQTAELWMLAALCAQEYVEKLL